MAVVVVRRTTTAQNLRGAAGAQVAVPETSETAEAGSGEGSKTGAEGPFGLASLLIVGVYWYFIVGQEVLADLKPAPAVQLAEGVAAFAMFYVAAQAIERVLEPIVSIDPWKRTKAKNRDTAMAAVASDPNQANATAAADAQAKLDQWRANRAVIIWALATILGMVASAKLGLYFVSALVQADPDPHLDIFITGLAIGGGTKPLHDLITNVQAKANQSSDQPTET
jgi:hypothetical protein